MDSQPLCTVHQNLRRAFLDFFRNPSAFRYPQRLGYPACDRQLDDDNGTTVLDRTVRLLDHDGTAIMTGGTKYSFTIGEAKQGEKETSYIGDLVDTKGRLNDSSANMTTLAERLTVAAKEHTANNLSVMAENSQDAESTIRDTDIAEEMMTYTKNNILIQSAQANAVPQGVLQLLG